MTPAMRDALLELRRPEDEDAAAIGRLRRRLDEAGVLGLVAEVALQLDVALDALLSCSRAEEVDRARCAAWARIRSERRWSFEQLARVFETKPHVIRQGVRSVEGGHARAA